MAFKNEKLLWNISRIASVGSSYRLPACGAAEDSFDKAAELSSAKVAKAAFEKASRAAFDAASSCRRAFDALYAAECAGKVAIQGEQV